MNKMNSLFGKLIFISLLIFASGTSIVGLAKVVGDVNLLSFLIPKSIFAANTSSCIITLFGQQYDVTELRTTHSGGDVFSCGTDMTSSYQSKHGTNLSRMQPYLVVATPTPTIVVPTSTPIPTATPTPTTPPTSEPTVTPTPTDIPTDSPSITPIPTKTITPTPTKKPKPTRPTKPTKPSKEEDEDDLEEIEEGTKCYNYKVVRKIIEYETRDEEDEDD